MIVSPVLSDIGHEGVRIIFLTEHHVLDVQISPCRFGARSELPAEMTRLAHRDINNVCSYVWTFGGKAELLYSRGAFPLLPNATPSGQSTSYVGISSTKGSRFQRYGMRFQTTCGTPPIAALGLVARNSSPTRVRSRG